MRKWDGQRISGSEQIMTKEAFIQAEFQLNGKSVYRNSNGIGSSPKVAISRAIAGVLKQMKRKRFRSIKATITVVNWEPPEPPAPRSRKLRS
jgi:hypothetical protein